MVDFSAEQKAALDLSTHVVIKAVAGSGKTTLLIERLERILEKNGFKPEQIVAITFTEEAVAQIKEGVRKKIEERMAQSNGSRNSWQQVYPLISLAKITTIHGFCASLLRDYPLEAGVDPGFSVLSPGEQKLRLLECVRQSLHDLSHDFDPDLRTLLDYIPRSSLGPIFVQMIERRSFLGQLTTGTRSLQKPWFEPLQRLYLKETAQIILRRRIWSQLEELLAQLPPQLIQAGDSYARRSAAQRQLFQRRPDLSPVRFLEQFMKTLSIQVSPSRQWKDSPCYEPLRGLWSSLRKDLRRYSLSFDSSESENRHFATALAKLASVYRKVLRHYQEQKAKDSVLDFEDLLIVAERLVARKKIRDALIQRYRYLLVDEFQDTNYLQWEIIQRMIAPGTNFLAVGDTKQSIYRFRDAEVTVFQELVRWVISAGRLVEMRENFRSLSPLIEFSNRLFRTLFQPGLDYEAEHQEMLPCRIEEPIREGAACVETFFYESSSGGSTPREAEVIARRIRRLVEEEGFGYSEIAILLRTRTRLKEYEESLRRAKVPFHTVGGIGLYERQEILDLVNLVRFLADPSNDVALLGVLRSPFFNLSDEDLFLLSLAPGTGYWEKLQRAAKGDFGDKLPVGWECRGWKFAVECLRVWIGDAHCESIAGSLRRALAETGYLEIVAASARPLQVTRNLTKFLDLVRAFEKGRSRTIREFLRFMDALIKGEPREAEAATYEELGEVVKIYTIHGAKGLQFPVVILPDLGAPLLSGRKDLFYFQAVRQGSSERTFLGLKIWNPESGYCELEHPVHKMLQRLDEYRQVAEEKRLLYVATTRARDRLILIGQRTSHLSYSRWLCESGAEACCSVMQDESSGTAGSGEEASKVEGVSFRSPSPRPERLRSPSKKLVWTPTELALFSRCPYKLLLSRIEGLPEGPRLDWERKDEKDLLVGSLIHELLERPTPNSASIERCLEIWKRRHEYLFSAKELGRMQERVCGQLKRVSVHPFYERLSKAHEVASEKSFHIRENGLLITGVIDKLFQEQDGRWVLVDFKTSEIPSEGIEAKIVEEGYDLQVEIYMWAVSRILSTQDVQGFLFFSHTGDLVPIECTPDLAKRCEALIASLPRRLDSSYFPKTKEIQYCNRCGFYKQGLCPGAAGISPAPKQKSLW